MSTWILLRTIGRDATLALQRELGGRKIYIPARMHAEHKIAKIIGLAAADALTREAGANMLRISRDQVIKDRNRRIVETYLAGADLKTITSLFNLKRRWLRVILEREGHHVPPEL